MVKKIKRDIAFDIGRGCGAYGKHGLPLTPYTTQNIPSPARKVEQRLGIDSSDKRYENMTTDILKSAAEMFIYLNACPYTDALLLFESQSTFYADLFKNSVDMVILTLNRLVRAPKNKIDDRFSSSNRAGKLLKRITSMLSLKYKDIQNLQPHKNGTFIE